MSRRNRVSHTPVFIVILMIMAIWVMWRVGTESVLFMPAALLVLIALTLILSLRLRQKARPRSQQGVLAHDGYVHVPHPPARERYVSARPAFSRTSRAANPETWPFDGSYCPHCGLKKRGAETLCRRCGQTIDYPA